MGLRFILGRCGTGKTYECLEEIGKGSGTRVFIVPEQFSLQAERDIIAHTDSKGIMEAQVLSFNRLAHHIFSQIGFSKTTPLTDIKKAMVLKKILLENQQKLQYFKAVANKQGFMEQLSTTISELYRYTVSPNQLLASINKGEESDLFSGKISDIALLYNEYSQNIKNGYLSADETLDLLYNCIDESDFIKSAEFWIDGFHGYTPQELKVIEKLLTYGVRVNVTLTIDGWLINKKDISPMNIFYEPWITYNNLTNLATEIGVKVEKPVILTDGLRYKNNDLMELEREFPRSHVKSQNSCENIEIYGGDNPFDEAEKAALKILELVNKGYRYKDIGLLAGTLETYEGILPQVMKECNIPFFMDNKRSILNHPFVGLVKGIMEIALYNLSYNAVFALLKTGLTSMAMEDIDILENYCLAHGIKSYKWKYEKWSFGIKDDESEKYLKINSLKDEFLNIFDPILTLNLKKKYTVDFITTAIYEILEAMGVKESLLEISKKNIESEHENRQCWNIVVDIFDALNEIMGKREVTLLEYYTLFEGGISVSNMGIIPPTVDSVTIGTLERSRLPKTKALIVIGVNEGVIPSGGAAQGILSDEERSVIESTGVRLAPSTLRRAFEEHFIIYSSITKSEQYLYLTYSMGDLAGKPLLPSSIIGKVREIFPTLKVKYSKDIKEEIFYSPAITLHHMGEGMAEGQKTQWLQVYSYLKSKSKWENKATIIAKGMEEPSDNNTLAQKTVDKLYGDVIFSSVSRLERFSACPYSYFLLYTLKAKERPVFALGVPDLGTLFHNVLEEFGKTLQQDNTNWADVSVEEISAMVSDIVDTQAPRLGSEILLSANSLVYLTKRLKRICTKAMVTLAKHLRLGKFEPYAYELGFGMGQKLPPIAVDLENGKRMLLNGKIDRVDILEKDGFTYVKIIDYKSGSSEFNLQDMYYGLQLQLLIYMDTLVKSGSKLFGKELSPAAMFYFKIKDPIIGDANNLTMEQIENTIATKLTMSGLVLEDNDVITAIDGSIENGSSLVMPVGLKKDGTYTAASKVASKEVFNKLRQYSVDTAKNIGNQIQRGNVNPKPYKLKGNTPCVYCSYKSVCNIGFKDRNSVYRHLKPLKDNEVKKLIEVENEID